MSAIQTLIRTSTSEDAAERDRALLLLDLAKTIAGPMAERMIVAPHEHGLTTSVADHAEVQAIMGAVALEAAAKVVVARFGSPVSETAQAG